MTSYQDNMLDLFRYSHLPTHLQKVSKPFAEMAEELLAYEPRNPVARHFVLKKLLEAKDAAVRNAAIEGPVCST